MPYTHVVTTAGTSALLSSNLAQHWLEARGADLVTVEPRRLSIPKASLPKLISRWTTDIDDLETGDPMRVSAEYSAVHALRRAGRLSGAPRVTLIHTDTPDGEFAAFVVASLIERDFSAHVETRSVGDLDADDPKRLRRSLGAFMHRVADALRQGDPRSTCFAPIGGYKVMTALGYVAGAFLRYPTLYLHETNQVPHEVPWVPIRLDEEELEQASGAVRQAVRGVAMADLSLDDQARVRALPWLFEVSDDGPGAIVEVNAFGHFLRSEGRYKPIIGSRVLVGADARKDLTGADPHFVWRQIDDLLGRLEDEVTHQGVLRHEASFGHQNVAWDLFKGASGGAGMFRAAYQWHPAHDVLTIRRAWIADHDRYEREAKHGGAFFGSVDDPFPLERPR